ncbi:MAG: hypothetical protein R2864_07485 [Syntrophotaleaceae bacterium]
MLIAIALRAFGCSVVTGIIAGAVLRKFRFKRAFCYSALWVPLGNASLGYLALSAETVVSQEKMIAMQKNFTQVVWTDLWVYGWYFLTLYFTHCDQAHNPALNRTRAKGRAGRLALRYAP